MFFSISATFRVKEKLHHVLAVSYSVVFTKVYNEDQRLIFCIIACISIRGTCAALCCVTITDDQAALSLVHKKKSLLCLCCELHSGVFVV